MMMEERIVIILGMDRLGTYFLSSWLHKCGLSLENGILEADTYSDTENYPEGDNFLNHFYSIQEKTSRNLTDRLFVRSIKYKKNRHDISNGKAFIQKKINHTLQWGAEFPPDMLMWDQLWQPIFDELKVMKKSVIIGHFRHYEKSVLSNMKLLKKRAASNRLYRYYLNIFKNKYANNFLAEWISFHKSLISTIKNNKYEMSLLLDTQTLLKHNQDIFGALKEDFKLSLSYSDPYDFLREKEITNEKRVRIFYKLDKKLLREAAQVYEELRKFKVGQKFLKGGKFFTLIYK